MLFDAENIVEQQPDSALRLLNTVLFPEDLNKSLFNKYNLLLLQAKDKSNKDITSDTVIFAVKEYYVQKKDYPNAALAAFYCGRVWHEQKNMENAANAYLGAIELAEKTNNYNLKGLIQGNLGILYREHLLCEKAIISSKKAVEMYDKSGNYRNKISAIRLIGDCFLLIEKTDSAFHYYNASLKLADSCNIPEQQANVKKSMGVAYVEQGLYAQAKKLFNEALAFPEDSVEQARILLNIAQIYALENRTDSVKFYLDKVLTLQIQDPRLMLSSSLLRSEIAEEEKNYPEALKFYKEYYNYTIEVFDSEENNKLLELQEKYDFEKLIYSKKESELKHQKALSLLFSALLITGMVFFVYYRKSAQDKRLILNDHLKSRWIFKSN